MVKIAAVSDLHGHLPEIPPCDVLLLAGDLCPVNDHSVLAQSKWFHGPFARWLDGVPAREVVTVAGNHDFVFQNALHMVPRLRWTYLQDSTAVVAGLTVYGYPWQPRFHDWAFNADDAERARLVAGIPDETEVLVAHGPPYGFGDAVPKRGGRNDDHEYPAPEHVGCRHLLGRIAALPNLKLAVFGHIHAGYGVRKFGGATLANVALVDEAYRPVNPVMTFDVG